MRASATEAMYSDVARDGVQTETHRVHREMSASCLAEMSAMSSPTLAEESPPRPRRVGTIQRASHTDHACGPAQPGCTT